MHRQRQRTTLGAVISCGDQRIRKLSLDFFRRQLAHADALPQLSLLAIGTGLAVGTVILLFRAIIDYILGLTLSHSEAFEVLAPLERLALPIAGALVLGLLLTRLSPSEQRVGVVHVMERLSRHQGSGDKTGFPNPAHGRLLPGVHAIFSHRLQLLRRGKIRWQWKTIRCLRPAIANCLWRA